MMSTLYEELHITEKDLTRGIPYFRIDNVVKYLSETNWEIPLEKMPSVRPPFDKLFMEFDDISQGGLRTLVAIQVKDNENWDDANALICVVYLGNLMAKLLVEYQLNKNGQLVIWGNETGHGFMRYTTSDEFSKLLSFSDLVNEEEIEYAATRASQIAIFGLGLMSCNNVDRIYIEPQKDRKRRKSKNHYKISYHVLNIRPMGTRKVYDKGQATDKKQPFHICRGHFKTFADNAPLFGRHVGTYWWSQQMRGKKEYGIVHKDYNIEIKTSDYNLIKKINKNF